MADAFTVEYNGFFDDQGRARGVAHYLKVAGHDVQIYVTKKRKKVRVFVNHQELTEGKS